MKTKNIFTLLAIILASNFFCLGQISDPSKEALKLFDLSSALFEPSGTIISNSIAFQGDLNDDGKIDAVVFYSLSPSEGGNAMMGQGFVVYVNNGKSLTQTTTFKPDYVFYVDGITNGKINIVKLDYAPGDSPNMPTLETHKYYILNVNKLQESKTFN